MKWAAAGGLHVVRSKAGRKERRDNEGKRNEIMWQIIAITSGEHHTQQCWPVIPGLRCQMQEDCMFEASLTPIVSL